MDEFGRIVERSGLGVFEEVGSGVKGSTGVERSIAVQGSIAVEGSTVGFTQEFLHALMSAKLPWSLQFFKERGHKTHVPLV